MVLRLLIRSSAFSERECEQTNGGSQGGGVCPQELEKNRSSPRGRFSCCCSRSAARAHAFLDLGFAQRTVASEHRILAWPSDLANDLHVAIVLFHRGTTFVVGTVRRISADNQERSAGRKALMAGAGRNDHGIAGFELDDASFIAAETHRCAPASDT